MEQLHGDYVITDDPARTDFARVHAWLTSSYWSPGTSRERVERAAAHSSLVVGAFFPADAPDPLSSHVIPTPFPLGDVLQVGYMRVISDRTTFAYMADVFVDEAHRRRGIAKAMVDFALGHPEHQGLRNWMLVTKDAHDVYRASGFGPYSHPDRLMSFRPQYVSTQSPSTLGQSFPLVGRRETEP